MRANPHNFISTVVIDSLHIVVRNTVLPFFVTVPAVCVIYPVVNVYTAPFGTNPQIAIFVFRHSSDDRATQTFLLRVSHFIAGIDFIFGIEVIHSTEISSQPKRPLFVFYDTPDRRVGESVGTVVVGSVEMKLACASVIPVQPVECSYPQISGVIFATASDKIGTETVRIHRVMVEVFNTSVRFYVVKSFFPATYP